MANPQVGEVFDGTVVDVKPFGSFVEHPSGQHGLLYGESAENGSTIRVQILEVDAENRRFSLKTV